ncbi:MAG: zinc-dependent peptidase [Sphingobacterium sp.]
MDSHSILIILFLFVFGLLLGLYVWKRVGNRKIFLTGIPTDATIGAVLGEKVEFYNRLNQLQQEEFRQRVVYFLKTTKISAEKGAVLEDSDMVLVGASATIPLFHFKQWAFENLDEVLIYPGEFNEKFDTQHDSRNILGMVGNGAMNRKMILSLTSLHAGFQKGASSNTALHEFVHLIDMADGQVDGVPEYLIAKELVEPWLLQMHHTIRDIRQDKSDIRDYAATNPAEFLAVVSEYFFQKPDLLKTDHPALFELLNGMYSRK